MGQMLGFVPRIIHSRRENSLCRWAGKRFSLSDVFSCTCRFWYSPSITSTSLRIVQVGKDSPSAGIASCLGHTDPRLSKQFDCGILCSGYISGAGYSNGSGLARYRFPGKTLYRGISYLPLIIPILQIAVATLVFFSCCHSPQLWTIVAAHVVFLAYVGIVVSSRLANLDIRKPL